MRFSKDDLILVSGASSGIGNVIASKLLSLGAKVVGVGRNADALKPLTVKYPESFFAEIKDLCVETELLPDWTLSLSEKYGRFSGFVSCAGVIDFASLNVLSLEDAKKLFDINFFSSIMLCKGMAKKKVRADKLSIAIVSSVSSLYGEPSLLAYAASKGALNSAVKTLAAELGRYGVRVNGILPGNISVMKGFEDFETDGNSGMSPKLPEPQDRRECVANLAAFLMSEQSYWITGQNIVIDGGETL